MESRFEQHSRDYLSIARSLMERLSDRRLDPRPHYRVLLAELSNDDIDEDDDYSTGVDRHMMGYMFQDVNSNNTVYRTVVSGYVRIGPGDEKEKFKHVKIVVSSAVSQTLPDVQVLVDEKPVPVDYIIHDGVIPRCVVRIPFEVQSKEPSKRSQHFVLEIIKRVARSGEDRNNVFFRIYNKTKQERMRADDGSYWFGHLLEVSVDEIADFEMKIPVLSFVGYNLLPDIDYLGQESCASSDKVFGKRSHARICGQLRYTERTSMALRDVYVVGKQITFFDYHVGVVHVPQIKPSGEKIRDIAHKIKSHVGVDFHPAIIRYVENHLESKGYTLYRFQIRAIEIVLENLFGSRDPVIISARTAAGKTEAFLLPVLNYILHRKMAENFDKKGVRAILIYPTKALANDQLQRVIEMVYTINKYLEKSGNSNSPQISVGVFHGDIDDIENRLNLPLRCAVDSCNTPLSVDSDGHVFCPKCGEKYDFLILGKERVLEDTPDILIATPDIINYSLTVGERHRLFYSEDGVYPEIVVLDEMHLFNSVFGKNVSYLLKRLRAIIQYYLSKRGIDEKVRLQLIGSSATVRNPVTFGKLFFASDRVHLVEVDEKSDYDEYASAIKKVVIFGMPLAYNIVDTATYSILRLFDPDSGLRLIDENGRAATKTLVFVNARYICDLIVTGLSYRFSGAHEEVSKYLEMGTHNSFKAKEERAEIEEKFNKGEIPILVSTSTLEVGVDFKDIDVLMLYQVPYSFNSYLQRLGRAGRKKDSIVYVLLDPNSPIDITYYRNAIPMLLYPNAFMEYPPFPRENEVIKRKQVLLAIADYCAACGYPKDDILRDLQDCTDKRRSSTGSVPPDLLEYLRLVGIPGVNTGDDVCEVVKRACQSVLPAEGSDIVSQEPICRWSALEKFLRLMDIRTVESAVDVTISCTIFSGKASGRSSKRPWLKDGEAKILRKIRHKR